MRATHDVDKQETGGVSFATNLHTRILAAGHTLWEVHQGAMPKSAAKFWSVYVPENKGLTLGVGRGAVEVPANSIALVPPGASAARDNASALHCLYLYFDIGGYTGEELLSRLNKILVIPASNYQSQLAALKQAIDEDATLARDLSAQGVLSAVLAEALGNGKAPRNVVAANDPGLLMIAPVLQAIEYRLYRAVYRPLKVQEMSAMCGLKATAFPRVFHKVLGKNPTQYTQERRIDVAVQQLLFTDKSIDQISADLAFANRFYFSRVFKDEVGQSPAAYREAFCRVSKN